MKRAILVLLAIGLILNIQLLFAQGGNDEPPQRMHRMERMLDLTDEQQSQMEDLRLKFEKEKLPLQSQIQKLRSDLKLELVKDQFDQKKVDQLVDQINSARKEIQKKRISHMREVRNILNDDQKKKFDMHVLSDRKFGRGNAPMPMHHQEMNQMKQMRQMRQERDQ